MSIIKLLPSQTYYLGEEQYFGKIYFAKQSNKNVHLIFGYLNSLMKGRTERDVTSHVYIYIVESIFYQPCCFLYIVDVLCISRWVIDRRFQLVKLFSAKFYRTWHFSSLNLFLAHEYILQLSATKNRFFHWSSEGNCRKGNAFLNYSSF